MNRKLYKQMLHAFIVCCSLSLFAQKTEKKFTETFNTPNNIELEINASYIDINVETWNKNQVKVETIIEIEGVKENEIEDFLKENPVEVLGNSKKIIITTSKGSFSYLNLPELPELPEIPELPELPEFPEFSELDFDFDFNFDFDFDNIIEEAQNIGEILKNEDFKLKWDVDGKEIIIKSKEDWEKFKKTDDYKELKKALEKQKEELYKSFKQRSAQLKKAKEQRISAMRQQVEARKQQLEVRKQQLKIQREVQKASRANSRIYSNSKKEVFVNGKKVSIKKRIEIKVPKKATFNLNTRHCKVKLPNTVAMGNVKYGSFDAENLLNSVLTINHSPVNINDLNTCSLSFNNVTDAKIASVTNSSLNGDSSEITILKLVNNVKLSNRFGKITIEEIAPNFKECSINLSYSEAFINLEDIKSAFKFNLNKTKLNNKLSKKLLDKEVDYPINANTTITEKGTTNNFIIASEFSTISFK